MKRESPQCLAHSRNVKYPADENGPEPTGLSERGSLVRVHRSNGKTAQDEAEENTVRCVLETNDQIAAPKCPVWSPKTQLSKTQGCLCPLQILSSSLYPCFDKG